MRRLAAGVELDDGESAPAEVRVVRESENNTWLSVTIHEGRYRQVRRMCEAVSLTVVRLKRVRYGFLGLEGLKTGKYRFLTADEAARLRRSDKGGRPAEKAPLRPAKTLEKKSPGKSGEKKWAGTASGKGGTHRR
jgi:23S rRNA pseudouridine2605 synthase